MKKCRACGCIVQGPTFCEECGFDDLMPGPMTGEERGNLIQRIVEQIPRSGYGKRLVIEWVIKNLLTDDQLQRLSKQVSDD